MVVVHQLGADDRLDGVGAEERRICVFFGIAVQPTVKSSCCHGVQARRAMLKNS
jgi:hypothetical protein